MRIEPEIIAKTRDIVNKYDELIDRMKILKEKIRESPELFRELQLLLQGIIATTRDVLSICKSTTQYNEDFRRYIDTYCEYIVLISIPYVIDLLKIMKNNCSGDERKDIENYIELFTDLIKNY